ncbi:MAG: hypothetical protein GX287_07070 [Fusobacteria bacterium]|nr:hypothetical protein [Fusobacteriota bacterium]
MAEIVFNIEKKLGTLSENKKGWAKEVNCVSWNNRKAKLDIREWDENHEKMGKGITFSREEIIKLKEILNEIDIENIDIG